jgi:hypothetical protein
MSQLINVRGGVGSGGWAPATRPQTKRDAEAERVLATMPQPLTEAALWQWIQQIAEHPTRAGARALAHLSELGRPAAPDAAVYLAKLSEAIARAVESKQASATLTAALKKLVEEAFTVGRQLGRRELEEQLAADATRPVLERHVEFLSDSTGKITGKVEREYKVRARAEAGREEKKRP